MPFAVEVVRNTPAWVFLLLGFLVWQGVKARRVRTLAIWRPFIVPVIFLLMGLMGLFAPGTEGLAPLIAWITALLMTIPIGIATGPRPLAWDRAAGRVTLPGSLMPLLRSVTVFSLQYGFAVELALHPEQQGTLAVVARAVSGATAGYFVGWAIGFWRHGREVYQGAPA
jgi:hypothetical protein